jgi:DNA-binding NarL/FixJ family response regulator
VIGIVIVDDTRLYRDGLADVLGKQEGIRVVDAISEPDQLIDHLRDRDADIVLMRMGMANSLGLLRALFAAAPAVKVVALGVSENEDEIIACAEAGVAGYLLRSGSFEDLLDVIRSVAAGETRCTPRIAATLLKRVATLAAERGCAVVPAHLTPREGEILELIERRLSNKEIAQRLLIDVRTVKTHVHNILEKLQVRCRGEAVARMRRGETGYEWRPAPAHGPTLERT